MSVLDDTPETNPHPEAATTEQPGGQETEIDRLRRALQLISGGGCAIYTEGRCWDRPRRTRERPPGSYVESPRGHRRPWTRLTNGWCDACVAADALNGTTHQEVPL